MRYQPSSSSTAFKDKKGRWLITEVDLSDREKNYMPGLWLLDLLSMSFSCMTVAESVILCQSIRIVPEVEVIDD